MNRQIAERSAIADLQPYFEFRNVSIRFDFSEGNSGGCLSGGFRFEVTNVGKTNAVRLELNSASMDSALGSDDPFDGDNFRAKLNIHNV